MSYVGYTSWRNILFNVHVLMKVDKIDSKMSDRKGLTGDRIGWQKLCTN